MKNTHSCLVKRDRYVPKTSKIIRKCPIWIFVHFFDHERFSVVPNCSEPKEWQKWSDELCEFVFIGYLFSKYFIYSNSIKIVDGILSRKKFEIPKIGTHCTVFLVENRSKSYMVEKCALKFWLIIFCVFGTYLTEIYLWVLWNLYCGG